MFFRILKRRVFIISIDGVPFSYLRELINKKKLPAFSELTSNGSLVRMKSVVPTISSVAWASFMTGKNPAKHNIYGFVDRVANPFKIFIPTSRNLKSDTIWEILGKQNKKVVVINVPMTYPPREVNGILVGCFLGTDINKIAYPQAVSEKLKEMGYIIDVDAWLARESKDKFLDQLYLALDKRLETALHFLKSEPWDFFMCHIMETDRLHHFFGDGANGDQHNDMIVEDFYIRLDNLLGQVLSELPSNVQIILLSDHGFCRVEKEVYLNKWLEDQGYLKFPTDKAESVKDMSAETSAYSLIPGRIFINLRGREEKGRVTPGKEYEDWRIRLKNELLELTDDTGAKIIDRVFYREDIYQGPFLNDAADLLATPKDGFDLKGNIKQPHLTGPSDLTGMHTLNDAFFYISGYNNVPAGVNIVDVAPTILSLYKVNVAKLGVDLDGVSLLN